MSRGLPRLLEAGLSPTTGPDENASILRRAGITALAVSIGAGITNTVLFAAAYQFRLDIQPTRIVAAGATSAELLRWAAVLDLFGYYLATAVLAYVLWRQLRPRNPVIADLSTLAGVGFALAGGAGAAVLAVFGPSLMHDYTDTAATEQVVIAAQFATLVAVVMRSIWQFLDGILIGVCWLGIGLLLRPDRPAYPASRWYLPPSQWLGHSSTLSGLAWSATFCWACSSFWGPHGGFRSWYVRAKPKLLPPLPRHDTTFATVGDLLSPTER
jgi:hypothetical protein